MPSQRFEKITSHAFFVTICINYGASWHLLSRIRHKRQRELSSGRGCARRPVGDLNGPTMRLTQLVNNGQSKATASCDRTAGTIETKKRLKDLTALLLWYARAIVNNFYSGRMNN